MGNLKTVYSNSDLKENESTEYYPVVSPEDIINVVKSKGSAINVAAGSGNGSAIITQFIPNVAEIKVGQNVTWYNPTQVSEPHTVTFIRNVAFATDELLHFNISKSSKLELLPPFSFGMPLVQNGFNKNMTIVAANAFVYKPVVFDLKGKVTNVTLTNNYTVDGTEGYINSGPLYPKDLVHPGLPATNVFTLKFMKPGIYDYMCMFHPWMTGKVIVK
jgi:plastocyanin